MTFHTELNPTPSMSEDDAADYRRRFAERLAQTMPGEKELVITEAKGSTIKASDGRLYLDMISGIAVANVGHSHPRVVAAVQEQMSKYAHVNVYGRFTLPPQVEIAERLASVTPGDLDVTFLVSTGTEATEGAMKLARKYTGRKGFVALERSFHGRTFGALSVSWREEWRKPFEPLIEPVTFVPFDDLDAAAQAVGDDTAAVIIEPVQGEAGVRIPSDDYLPGLRELCTERGALLICDEIQGGMGRSGRWFSCENWDVTPDIITVAKAFGAGLPLGAFVSTEEIFSTFLDPPLSHLTTFGGNPVACCAAIAAFDVIEEENLVERASELGGYLRERLSSVKAQFPDAIGEIRGIGLWFGVDFNPPEIAQQVVDEMQRRGAIVGSMLNAAGTVRIAPPLIVTHAEIDAVVGILRHSLNAVLNG